VNVAQWLTQTADTITTADSETLCLYWALSDAPADVRRAAGALPTATSMLLATNALATSTIDQDIRDIAIDLRALLVAQVRRPAAPPAGLAVCKGLRATDRVTARGQLLIGEVADLADQRHTSQGSLLE
jgi:hypothetical protein